MFSQSLSAWVCTRVAIISGEGKHSCTVASRMFAPAPCRNTYTLNDSVLATAAAPPLTLGAKGGHSKLTVSAIRVVAGHWDRKRHIRFSVGSCTCLSTVSWMIVQRDAMCINWFCEWEREKGRKKKGHAHAPLKDKMGKSEEETEKNESEIKCFDQVVKRAYIACIHTYTYLHTYITSFLFVLYIVVLVSVLLLFPLFFF